jgi:hypothetical protein
MVHFAAVIRDGLREGRSVAEQRHIIAGKEYRSSVARYGDGATYQYCILSSSDRTTADDVVSALFSFPVSNVPGLIARIYAVPKDECSTGIELFQEANETVTVRVGGNDALRCPSAEWSKPCPPEPQDSNLQLQGGVGQKRGSAHERECVVLLSWRAIARASVTSKLHVTYQFPNMPYQTSIVHLSPNTATAMLNARTLELTLFVRGDPLFPRIAVLRWGAREGERADEQEAAELRSATTLISGANWDKYKFTDDRVLKAITRFVTLAGVGLADLYYTNLPRTSGKRASVLCTTTESTISSGRKLVTSCHETNPRR